MSLSTFPIERLPPEFQLQVWSHAAAPPPGTEAIREIFYVRRSGRLYLLPILFNNNQNLGGPADLPRWFFEQCWLSGGFAGRRAMMGTCKLARPGALEAWKRDLDAIQNERN